MPSRRSPTMILLGALIVGALLAAAAYQGMLYPTGAAWYHDCWEKAHASGRQPSSPEEGAVWASCGPVADAALYGAGFIQAGNPQWAVTPQLKALQSACPNGTSEMASDGWWINAVQMVEQGGGPSVLDHLLPAGRRIIEEFRKRWPDCPTVRAANGFPKVVLRGASYVYEAPCEPCSAELSAIQAEEKKRLEELTKPGSWEPPGLEPPTDSAGFDSSTSGPKQPATK